MDTTIAAATALSGLNVLLLAALTVIWVRNYRTVGSALTLGLVAFGIAMLAENALAIYYFFGMAMFYSGDPGVQQAVLVLRALQLVAIAILTYVTVQ